MKQRFLGGRRPPLGLIFHLTRRRELSTLMRFLELDSCHRVADVACGNGYVTGRYASRAAKVFGADINESRIASATRSADKNSFFVVAAAEAIPWASHSMDRLISVCALEHFQNDQAALTEMGRVLKQNGVLALSVDSLSVPTIPAEYVRWHRRECAVNNYYDLDKLSERLRGAGLKITDWRFLVTNPWSDRLIRLANRHRWVRWCSFPLTYSLTILLDKTFGEKRYGHKLIVRAVPARDGNVEIP